MERRDEDVEVEESVVNVGTHASPDANHRH